jgi:hypothetical protein
MSKLREEKEAELRRLLNTEGGAQRIREMYEEITGERLPPVAYLNGLFPTIVDRHVQDAEVAMILKDFLPAPEAISSLSPQDVGERLLLFFGDLVLKNQQRNAIKRDYIGGRYPVQHYPTQLQNSISNVLLEGWDWLVSQGMIVKENKGESFVLTRRGEDHLRIVREKQGRFIIFYSWQSDLPRSRNQGFIQECLEEAIAQVSKEPGIVLVPSIDRDTQGEPGSPAIADTILAKIDNCDMFVCDVSIINNDENPKRPTPNPNVLLELGWAAQRLGWERITNVFNLAYGRIEDLPFDLKQRRVVGYALKPEENKTGAKKSLVEALVLQIKAVMAMRQ